MVGVKGGGSGDKEIGEGGVHKKGEKEDERKWEEGRRVWKEGEGEKDMGRRQRIVVFFFFNDTATTEFYTLPLHDALPILPKACSTIQRTSMARLATR